MTDTAPAPVAAEPTAAETAGAELQSLQSDAAWKADWSGANGHTQQRAAVQRKSDLARAAAGVAPDAAPVLPEKVQAGLKSNDSLVRATAEGMIPAQDPSEYHFNWEGASTMDAEQHTQLDAMARATAFAVGANPAFATSTIQHIDQQLAHSNYVPTGNEAEALHEHMTAQFGDKADATLSAAQAVLDRMPPDGKAWVQGALSNVDATTASWIVQRLARLHASQN